MFVLNRYFLLNSVLTVLLFLTVQICYFLLISVLTVLTVLTVWYGLLNSVLTVLEYPYWQTLLYWHILTDGIFCTGIILLTDAFVLEYPYWQTFLYWHIRTDGRFCTGISLLTDFFVLEYPYWQTLVYHRNVAHSNDAVGNDIVQAFEAFNLGTEEGTNGTPTRIGYIYIYMYVYMYLCIYICICIRMKI